MINPCPIYEPACCVMRAWGVCAMRAQIEVDRVLWPSDRALQFIGPVDPWEGEAANEDGPYPCA